MGIGYLFTLQPIPIKYNYCVPFHIARMIPLVPHRHQQTSSALHFHILNVSTVNTDELQNVDISQVGKILNLRGG